MHAAGALTSPAPSSLWTPAFTRATLAHLLFGIGNTSVLHFSGLLQKLGALETEIGTIIAINALTACVLGPPAGALIDKHGRAPMVRVGGSVLCVVSLGYALMPSLGVGIYALRALDGLGSVLLYAGLFTYAGDIVPPERRTQGLALFGAAGLAPLAISSFGGDLLLAIGSYRALFLVAAGFFAAGVLLAMTLPDMRGRTVPALVRTSMWTTASQRDLRPVWSAAFAFFLGLSAVATFMKTFVLELGLGSVGPFFVAYSVVALCLRLLLGSLPDRIGTRRMVLPALLSYAAGAIVLSSAHSTLPIVLAGALCGAGHGYGFPVLLSLTVSRAPEDARGAATAIFTAVDWAGHIAAPPLIGYLIEHFGYDRAWLALAALLTTGVLAFYWQDRS
jgi:MFS family permease